MFAMSYAVVQGSMLQGCASHVVLRSPPGAASAQRPAYVCRVGEAQCAPSSVVDESLYNMSGTSFLPLPRCTYGVSRILIQDADGTPTAYVECAEYQQPGPGETLPGGDVGGTAPGGGLGETATGGGLGETAPGGGVSSGGAQ